MPKLRFKNIADDVVSLLSNAATVAREWVFPDKDGTVAMLDDVAIAQQAADDAQADADSAQTTANTAVSNAASAQSTANTAVTNAATAQATANAAGSAATAAQGDIDTHEARTDNPHGVTKAQVGLSNVPNLSFSGSNTGDQDLSGLAVKSANLSDLTNAVTARSNLGLGTLATQNGTFSGTHSGTSSGTNTGDQDLSGLVSNTRTISTTSPLSGGGDLSANRTLSIADAAADGSTKGAAAFTAADFNSASGVISIDYANGQKATELVAGFVSTAAQRMAGDKTFDNKLIVKDYVIIATTGNSYATDISNTETGPALYTRKVFAVGSTNEHGIICRDLFDSATFAYAAYDAQSQMAAGKTYNHYAGFQQRGELIGSANCTIYYSIYSAPTTAATSTIGTLYHFRASSALINASTSITNAYSFRAEALKGTNKWAFYADSDVSYFGGNVSIGTQTTTTSVLGVHAAVPTFGMGIGATVRMLMGIASATNVGITGTATNDYYIRTPQKLLLSADDGTTIHFAIASTGNFSVYRTFTAGGTTGAQTINKPSGSVNFAAAASTLVVTNSLVTTSSIVILTVHGTDATATSARVTTASGSFTITLNAAATAETRVSFLVLN